MGYDDFNLHKLVLRYVGLGKVENWTRGIRPFRDKEKHAFYGGPADKDGQNTWEYISK